MAQEIFYPDLNTFCRMYFDANRPISDVDRGLIHTRWNVHEASLFEQLMLFDKISFKVYGENMLLGVLIRMFGMKGFEELVEQKAVGFTLWTTDITYLVTEAPGVDPLQFITQSSGPHVDPEASVMAGFKWMSNKPSYDQRRRLVRKIAPLYRTVPNTFSQAAVNVVRSAYHSGKLNVLGMVNTQDYQRLPIDTRKQLCACGAEALEYSYLLSQQMTSYSNPNYYALFNDTAAHVRSKDTLTKNFQAIATIECFPDLPILRSELKIPLTTLPKLRQKRNSKQFRAWLADASYSNRDTHITKDYVDAIADAKGFFETRKGKITKSIAMTAIGTGIGALVAGAEGTLMGPGVAKVLEPVTDWGLDLVDEFILSGLTKGWTPQMFFDDLRKLNPPT
jgi:hypothetical protein